MTPESLDELREQYANYPFPNFVFNRDESALFLCCAGFYGGHDVLRAMDAGLSNVVGVDINGEKLGWMRKNYPPGWIFIKDDVYTFKTTTMFDLVCADVQLSQIEQAMQCIELWSSWANRHFIINITSDTKYKVPKRWRELGKIFRNEEKTTAWLVMARRLTMDH